MIDLRSDTVTRPSDEMRSAAAEADVGDDVYGEDPTANELEARAADLLGTEAALYCPSGTMANQIAIRTHTEPGQELICEQRSHVFQAELAGSAVLAGLQTRPVDAAPRGVITPEIVEENLSTESDHVAGTGLLTIENTHNMLGGRAIAPEELEPGVSAAHDAGVPVHLDGARLCNAAVALGVAPADLTGAVDSVMLSLSKGLGAPIGSVLGGPAEFIDRAHRIRKQYGGGMRQVGVIAGPALLALENVDRLAEDHGNADRLAAGLEAVEGLDVQPPETNMVFVRTDAMDLPTPAFLERLDSAGVRAAPIDEYTTRWVTHLDVTDDDIDEAVTAVEEAVG